METYIIIFFLNCSVASQVVLVVKNPLANAGNVRDVGSIPGLGRSPEGEHNSNPPRPPPTPSILAWRIAWTEEHGELQSMRSQRVRHD